MCDVVYVRSKEDLERFLEQYYLSSIGYVRGISSLDEGDAADVVAKSEDKARKKIDKYDPNKPFKCWYNSILYRETKNWYRLRARAPIVFIPLEIIDIIIPDEGLECLPTEDDQAECEAKTIMRMEAVLNLVRLLFRCGGYPHEQMAFTYAKVIHGKLDKKRNLYINAKEMDAKYGSVPLSTLVNDCPSHWKVEIRRKVRTSLKPVKRRMEEKTGVLVKTERIPDSLHDTLVKNTCWRDYYPADSDRKNHTLTDWCNRVVTRLRDILNVPGISDPTERMANTKLKSGSCVHCKLRHVPVLGCPAT